MRQYMPTTAFGFFALMRAAMSCTDSSIVVLPGPRPVGVRAQPVPVVIVPL